MVVMPEDFKQWSVQLELSNYEVDNGKHDRDASKCERGSISTNTRGSTANVRGSTTGFAANDLAGQDSGKGRSVPSSLFEVKRTHAHTAASVVRLLLRWVGATQRSPALKEAIDHGFIFCLITGLCETRHFSKRRLSKHGVVSVLAHRMALHVAASQKWRALAPSLKPPQQFQEEGLQGIECAEYTAYYAFLRPLRLAFTQLKPMLPVVCLVWGEAAKQALLEFPRKSDHTDTGRTDGPKGLARSDPASPKGQLQMAMEDLIDKAPSSDEKGSGSGWKPQGLTSFLDVASEHLAQIQLVDNVSLDVLTGKVVLLMYTASVDSARAPDAVQSEQALVLLLDASRGMQVIASPIPARELRRCAL